MAVSLIIRPKPTATILSSIKKPHLLSDIRNPCSIQAIDCFVSSETILQSA